MKAQLTKKFLCVILMTVFAFGFKQDQKITLTAFNQKIAAPDKVSLVFFSAKWCAICPQLKPSIDEIENEKNPKLQVIRVDTDRDKEVAEEFEVSSLPVLMIYKNGKREWIHVGLIDKVQLRDKVAMY